MLQRPLRSILCDTNSPSLQNLLLGRPLWRNHFELRTDMQWRWADKSQNWQSD